MASIGISIGFGSSASATDVPFTTFNFLVEIDVEGVSDMVCSAMFSDLDGLEMNLEPKTIREGGNNTGPVHMAGQSGIQEITLKRGMTPNFDLWSWFDAVSAPGGGGLRGSASIVMLGSDGTPTGAVSVDRMPAGETESSGAERQGWADRNRRVCHGVPVVELAVAVLRDFSCRNRRHW